MPTPCAPRPLPPAHASLAAIFSGQAEDAGLTATSASTPLTSAGQPGPQAPRKKTPALMLLGVSSNAGKSLLTCAMGRIFAQAGWRPAPFKAQNMTSQAHRLPDGGRMSGAQALQAIACHRAPDQRMNPVLMRPQPGGGSEVIVMGESLGVLSAREWLERRAGIFARVCAAYDSLAAEADVMLLEGAGSPAEINLRAHDIVNMGMAAHADASALLVGDIDRGGVFAHFLGTLELLEAADRARVKGLVINRFRGDASLLEPAMRPVAARTGVPFAGVVPAIAHDLPQEDSLAAAAHGGWGLDLADPRLEAELDRVAEAVRASLDLPAIFSLLFPPNKDSAP